MKVQLLVAWWGEDILSGENQFPSINLEAVLTLKGA